MTDNVLLPSNVAVEEALIGAVVVAGRDAFAVVEHVTGDDFMSVANGWVWDAIRAVYLRGEAVELLTVQDELRHTHPDEVEIPGITRNLAGMVIRNWDVADVGNYAAIILDYSWQRRAMLFASDVATQAVQGTRPADILHRIDVMTARLRDGLPGDDGLHRGTDAHATHKALVAQRMGDSAPTTYTIPYSGFASAVPLIKAGKFVLVSALSGHGKTIICEEMAEWIAMGGGRVLYVTTELTAEDHLDRRYVRHSGLPYVKVIAPDEDAKTTLDALEHTIGWQHRIDFWEVHESGHETVIAQMQRAYEFGVRAFFIDYFTEILADPDYATIQAAVMALHTFAKTHESLVVVASQLTETDHGLRTYGTRRLEHKCAVHLQIGRSGVLDMHKDYTIDGGVLSYDSGEADPVKQVTVKKNNYGPAHCDIPLFLHGQRFRFLGADQVGYGITIAQREDATADALFAHVNRGGKDGD